MVGLVYEIPCVDVVLRVYNWYRVAECGFVGTTHPSLMQRQVDK